MLVFRLLAIAVIWIVWSIVCAFALCFAAIAAALESLAETILPTNWNRNLPIARQSSRPDKKGVRLALEPDIVKRAIEREKSLSPLVDRLLRKHLDPD